MNDDPILDAWKASRARPGPDEDFVRRVMERLPPPVARFASSPPGRAIVAAVLLAGFLRHLGFLYLFLE